MILASFSWVLIHGAIPEGNRQVNTACTGGCRTGHGICDKDLTLFPVLVYIFSEYFKNRIDCVEMIQSKHIFENFYTDTARSRYADLRILLQEMQYHI
jgi:hypothetical protein